MNIIKLINDFKINNSLIWVEANNIRLFVANDFEDRNGHIDTIKRFKPEIVDYLVSNKIFSKEDFQNKTIFQSHGNKSLLSFAQKRLWFIELYEQGSHAYHIPLLNELDADTDTAAIKYALQQIVSRHEVLRTTIEHGDGEEPGIQVVHDEPLLIEEITLTGKQHFKSLIEQDISRPFDLSAEYPLRVKFYTIRSKEEEPENSRDKTVLLINFHHIASDGWSIEIFEKELHAYCEAYNNKDPGFCLPALEIQYKDYAVWQRTHLTGKILEKQLSYWKNKLSGYQTLELPTDYARPGEIDYCGSILKFRLSEETSQKLRVLAQRYGVTLYSVLLSSINILLSKYTGQEDIITGSVIANRHHRQTRDLIGFFVNTLANRTLLNRSQSFAELIQQVHQDQVEAQLYQDLPFEKLVEELGVERNISRHPVFQVMFGIEAISSEDEPTAENSPYHKPLQAVTYEVEKFDLSIHIDDSRQELMGRISYATSLFQKDTIERLIYHYTYLLEQLTESPEQPYSQHSLLNPREYEEIVYDWNATNKDYLKEETLYQLFQVQAEKTPDNIALVYEGKQLSYRQLNEKSNQLARHLRTQYHQRTKQSLVPGTLFALHLDRDLEMVIGMLAVLKAGGAYVPMDITYPQERIDYILEDTKAELILSQRQLNEDGYAQLPPGKVIYIDLAEKFYKEEDGSNLLKHSKATDLAYVIYTSGTTGKPNGVMVEHGSVINLMHDLLNRYSIDSSERILLFANYVFDASVEQIFLSLLSGAALYVIGNKSIIDSNIFENYILKNKITHLHSTPSFLSSVDPSKLHLLNRVVFGAEYLSKQLFDQYKTIIPTIINEYGPTESTITSLVSINSYLLSRATIQNTKAYVLDPGHKPVPIGVLGELYLGGAGISRGYLNNPDLTALRFIANPFGSEADKAKGYTRLYKTGDLVRWLPGGNLEYIGRNDDQVKIRGFRIELGEIEYALSQITGIKQCCVLAKDRKTEWGSSKFLVGYYVLESKVETLTQTAIYDELTQVLPEYMVPGALVAIKSFPLTINGKLDKRALPDPDFNSSEGGYVAPANEIETALCKIWQEVLGLERVGILDDFFRIGGDSILSIQVTGRIRQGGFNCQVKEIFEYRTIAKLAAHLGKKSSELAIQSEQGILKGDVGLLPIQQWFLEKVDKGEITHPNHWNQSFLVRVPALAPGKLATIIKEIVAYQDVLRIQYFKEQNTQQSASPGIIHWKQVYQPGIEVPELRIIDVSKHTETEVQKLLTGWQSGFDLERGPLFQAGYLYGYEDGSARIYFALHHMLVDAVSWGILADDLRTLYEGRLLPAKGSSYRQWVERVRSYAGQHLSESAYWEEQLNSIPGYLIKYSEKEPCEEFFELNKKLTRSLLKEAPKAYQTEINDLLLTALAYALKELNQNDIQCITLEGHGREEIDASIDHSRTVGWFTTMFPVKLELQNNLEESIQFIKESLRRIPNKGIGFGVFATDAKTNFTHQDLAPVSFNYLGQYDMQEGDWQIAAEGSGESMHPANGDHNLININGMVSNGKLWFSIVTKLGEDATKQLCDGFKIALTKIIGHCEEKLKKKGSSSTPSDFNSVRISQLLLNRLETAAKAKQNEIAHIYPATSLQQGFIYHALSQPADDAYRLQLLYDYHLAIDTEKYIKAWELCISQYPILRTAFNWEEDIIQVIYKYGKLEYQSHDISYLVTQVERDAAIETIQLEDRKQGFDLTKPTLLRLHIIKQSEAYYTILKSEHHSISDGWSGPILFTSLYHYYQELTKNKNPRIKEDTAYLETQEYISRHKGAVEEYWKTILSEVESANDINALLSEPIDAGNYKQVEKPATCTLELTGDIYNTIKAFSQREGITLNVIVQFIWHKMLHVYSNSLQSIVGTTVSGRDLPVEGIEESVGLYINTLPLIINWENDNTIQGQLHQIQQKITELNTHSFAELAKLQRGGERLFHSLFVYENYPVPKEDKDTPKISIKNAIPVISIRDAIEKVDYPLSIIAYEYSDTLTIQLEYDGNYLSEEKAHQHIKILEHIIHQVIKNPGKPQQQISLLLDEEYGKIIYQWNNNDKDYPKDKTIYELFQEQVEKTPGNIALAYEEQKLTYKELNEKSNQLARRLRAQYKLRTKQELNPDTLIALYLDRSLEMIIGILAVLKAGGAYVPIDVNYPRERIDYLLEDTGAQLILSQRRPGEGNVTLLPQEKVIYIDLAEDFYDIEDTSNLLQHSRATDLAYMIYTSGSTGRSKGVAIEHTSVVNMAIDRVAEYKMTTGENSLQIASICFDASVEQIFVALFSGAQLTLINKELLTDVEKCELFFNENKITHLDTVPSFLETLDFSKLKYLKRIASGGESCTVELVNRILPYMDFYNEYGPTEATVIATQYKIGKGKQVSEVIPIGRPINNTKILILDNYLSNVPIGIVGEIYIGGEGLARGYHHCDKLMKENFIDNPYGAGRLYKTGDWGRWRNDGQIEYKGRKDNQVKIRGFRIELGEIEYALTQITGIKQCCVLAKVRKTETGWDKYLVAYYILDNSDEIVTKAVILEKLSQQLPEFMLPGALVEMESFPLTINGKLDKEGLPDPDFNSSGEEYVAPITETDAVICSIWQAVLGLDRVGITDNFFRLGGNSILAIQVSHRMSRALGCDVKVADVFKYKTISQLRQHSIGQTQSDIPKENMNRAVLSFAQERLWFIEQYEQGSNAYHIPAVFELDVDTDIAGIKYALQQIVSRHEVLRSTIEQGDSEEYGIQQVHDEPLQIEEVTLTDIEDFGSLVEEDINRPFDLIAEYPIRVKFYHIQSDKAGSGYLNKTLLLINTHHIASDGWSTEIFDRELYTYYEAYINNDTGFSLPALEIQYKDYAVWQRNHITGEILEKQLSYWKDKLSGYQTLELPTDYVRPGEVDYSGSSQQFIVDGETSQKLRALAQRFGVTLHSVMLSSISILLSKYTGQEDIVTGSVIANRHHRQTEELIGFFVNTQVNRMLLNKTQSYVDLVQQVHKEQILAQLYQDLPFEILVDELGVERDSSRHPVFQVMFGIQDIGNQDIATDQPKNYLIPFQAENAYEVEKFDLSVFIYDGQRELIGQVSYATALFHEDTIVRLIRYYTYLLEQLTDAPEQPYSQHSLLNPEEFEQVVYDWNATDNDYPKEKTVYQVFEEQVEKIPDDIALVYEGQQLSYKLLNEKSNQLARHIREQYLQRAKQPLAPDTLIALYLDRSLEMVIGILAVLKAGGAYVPIDTNYPQERIYYILEDTQAELILSRRQLYEGNDIQLPPRKVINIDLEEELYKVEDTSNLPIHSNESNLAYVIYTSGTTGKPKGVMVEHHQILTFVIENNFINYEKVFVVAGVSNYAFDGSIFDIFFSLINGRKLILIDSYLLELSILDNQLTKFNVDTIFITTALFNSLVQNQSKCLDVLQQLLFGGEASNIEIVNNFKSLYEKTSLIHVYGPTENIVYSSYCKLNDYDTKNVVPIGTRLFDKKLYVLNNNLSPVPIGVIGELYIGGAGLARGYLNRHDLTEERFIHNPFATEADKTKGYTRLYKTGDLVRWLPDGNLEYIGRNDEQVKIRGFRIELGEIEHALSQIKGIRQSCVIAKERETESGGNKYLVGYYVSDNNDDTLTQTSITGKLSQSLPEYMIPGTFVAMESFPLTINGKLNKRALPDPGFNSSGEEYVAPVNETEAAICNIWQEALGLDRVGITDNFFRIGGNSILAIQVSHRMSKSLGCDVKVADVFKLKNIQMLLDNVSVKQVNPDNVEWDVLINT
ncbi:MAG: amino acid adenylation domain-containing protein [Ferruginibacter sp.]